MNYIALINNFWLCYDENSFTPQTGFLYFALLRISNSKGWKNPFRQSNSHLASMAKISEPTLIKCRNQLQQAGLIEFQSGKTDRTLTTYCLKDFSSSFSSSFSSPLSSSFSSSDENRLDNNKHKQNKTFSEGDASLTPEKKSAQKSGKGAKSEKPESAARVKTHKIERNPLWMKHWADFQESYPKTYRTDWKKAEELFAELLHKDGLNDDETVGRRGRWLVTQAHFYGELCKYEHREEQFVKAADKWLADEDEYKRDYRKIIDAMPKNGRGSPMPEGMVL